MTDEVELVDPQDTDDDEKTGFGLNLQVLTFLLVAATFVWVTGTPTLQETKTTEWKVHDLQTGETVHPMHLGEEATCHDTKRVRDDMVYGFGPAEKAKSDDAACFEQKKYVLKQVEVYGHKFTYSKETPRWSKWEVNLRYADIAG